MGDISGEIRCVKVKFLGSSIEQVRWGSNDNPDGVLVKDAEYELLREEVHTSHTKYHLKDFPGKRFNSASFEPSRIYGGWNAYESPASPSPTQQIGAHKNSQIGPELGESSLKSSEIGAQQCPKCGRRLRLGTFGLVHDSPEASYSCMTLASPTQREPAPLDRHCGICQTLMISQRVEDSYVWLCPNHGERRRAPVSDFAPLPATQREPEDEMLVALDDTTTCLGNLLGTLIVHYPDFAANHLVKADVDIAVMRLHLSKELLIHLKGEPALEFKPTSFCEECCNAICTCAATQREEASRDTQLEKLDHVASELFVALRGIIDIGKRDMSNPKYAPYFDHAKEVLDRLSKQAYAAPGPSLPTETARETQSEEAECDCGKVGLFDGFGKCKCPCHALDALPTEAPRVEDGWIDAQYQKPPFNQSVLVWVPIYRNQYTAFFNGIEWRHFADGGDRVRHEVTHWKPLGPPPATPRHRDPEDKC